MQSKWLLGAQPQSLSSPSWRSRQSARCRRTLAYRACSQPSIPNPQLCRAGRQLEKQVVMVENQLNQLADMANTESPSPINSLDRRLGHHDVAPDRQHRAGALLHFEQYGRHFPVRFPGYSPSTNYGQSYQTWSQTSLDSTLVR